MHIFWGFLEKEEKFQNICYLRSALRSHFFTKKHENDRFEKEKQVFVIWRKHRVKAILKTVKTKILELLQDEQKLVLSKIKKFKNVYIQSSEFTFSKL